MKVLPPTHEALNEKNALLYTGCVPQGEFYQFQMAIKRSDNVGDVCDPNVRETIKKY